MSRFYLRVSFSLFSLSLSSFSFSVSVCGCALVYVFLCSTSSSYRYLFHQQRDSDRESMIIKPETHPPVSPRSLDLLNLSSSTIATHLTLIEAVCSEFSLLIFTTIRNSLQIFNLQNFYTVHGKWKSKRKPLTYAKLYSGSTRFKFYMLFFKL